MSDNVEVMHRAQQRDRKARKAAEQILEQKSRELYQSNVDLKKLADDLRLEIERSEILMDSASDAIITIWSDNTIALFNSAAERIFGYPRHEVVGNDITQFPFTAPGENRRLSYQLGNYKSEQTNSMQVRELRGQSRDGTPFFMELTSNHVNFGGKNAITIVIRDVTARKELEKQLRHGQKMESVGRLAAGIAHEINTPIQFVGDNCRFLKDAFDDLLAVFSSHQRLQQLVKQRDNTDALIEAIEKETEDRDLEFVTEEIPVAVNHSLEGIERVARIVSAMKDFAHPGEKQKQRIDLNRTIESTVIVCRNEWAREAELSTEFDNSLPMVNCHSDEIKQVVLNLTVNAGHAIADANRKLGRTTGQIHISTQRDNDDVVIRIGDTGLGIPKGIRPKVFDPFFTTKETGSGTGQGLAIAYSIVVDMHGGSIKFDTEANVGTTFEIRLPIQPETLTAPTTRTSHEKANTVC